MHLSVAVLPQPLISMSVFFALPLAPAGKADKRQCPHPAKDSNEVLRGLCQDCVSDNGLQQLPAF